jgi:hypothetical protein
LNLNVFSPFLSQCFLLFLPLFSLFLPHGIDELWHSRTLYVGTASLLFNVIIIYRSFLVFNGFCFLSFFYVLFFVCQAPSQVFCFIFSTLLQILLSFIGVYFIYVSNLCFSFCFCFLLLFPPFPPLSVFYLYSSNSFAYTPSHLFSIHPIIQLSLSVTNIFFSLIVFVFNFKNFAFFLFFVFQLSIHSFSLYFFLSSRCKSRNNKNTKIQTNSFLFFSHDFSFFTTNVLLLLSFSRPISFHIFALVHSRCFSILLSFLYVHIYCLSAFRCYHQSPLQINNITHKQTKKTFIHISPIYKIMYLR